MKVVVTNLGLWHHKEDDYSTQKGNSSKYPANVGLDIVQDVRHAKADNKRSHDARRLLAFEWDIWEN